MNNILTSISFASFFENPTADTNDYAEDLKSFSLENNELPNPQKINFFIGENNSGKSRFIRTVMKWFRYSKEDKFLLFNFIKRYPFISYFFENLLNGAANPIVAQNAITPIKNDVETFFGLEKLNGKPLSFAKQKLDEINKTISDKSYLLSISSLELRVDESLLIRSIAQLQEYIGELSSQIKNCLKNIKSNPINVLYIPLLRGAKLLGENLKEDFYLKRTTNDYVFEENEVFTGLSIYKDLQNSSLGSAKDKKLITNFENLLSTYFFEGKTVSITANKEKDWVGLQIGEEEERPLHKLGDGVQALIVLLFPLYMRKEEEYFIFIEEPEMHLYPKWQRLFIKILQTEFSKHQFFITTHSNVFINMEGSSVYQVTRDHSETKSFVKYALDDEKREIINSLGYKASDVLQANYIIWVEGPTDPIYLRKFLELYDGKLTEGIDYAFMSFNGYPNLYHFAVGVKEENKIDVTKINPHCGFIIDSDRALKGGGIADDTHNSKQKIQSQCIAVGLVCWITEKKELENHIIPSVWRTAYNNPTSTLAEHPAGGVNYDWDYHSRFSSRDTSKPRLNPAPSNKVEAAKKVIKIITKSDLEADTELDAAMTNLVKAIREANKKH